MPQKTLKSKPLDQQKPKKTISKGENNKALAPFTNTKGNVAKKKPAKPKTQHVTAQMKKVNTHYKRVRGY